FQAVFHMSKDQARQTLGYMLTGTRLAISLTRNMIYTGGDLSQSIVGLLPENPFAFQPVSLADRAASAYGWVSVIVSGVDFGMQLAAAFGADEDNAFCKDWAIFSQNFNTYATPQGLATLLADYIVSFINPANTPADSRAWAIKQWQLNVYNTFPASTITACTLDENTAGAYGGAINLFHSDAHIEDCFVQGNSAAGGGALSSGGWNTPVLMSSVLESNTSFAGHSAVYNYSKSRMQMVNCTVINNGSQDAGGYAVGNE